ncbi:MAG: DUF2382 domain-containing protein [Verrucomicrobiia bacterium]
MNDLTRNLALIATVFAVAGGCSREPETTPTDSVQVDRSPSVNVASDPVASEPVAVPADPAPAVSSGQTQQVAGPLNTPAAAGGPAGILTGEASSQDAQSGVSRSSQYIDYEVVSRQGENTGRVETVWEDPAGEPAFIGVKRPGQDKLVIIPADAAQVNEGRKTVRLSLTPEALQSAPTLEQDAELDEQVQKRVTAYYQEHTRAAEGAEPGQASAPAVDAERQDQATVQLREEKATVGTRTVDAGGVLLRKVVRTVTNREPVTLRREEVVIERVPGGGEVTNSTGFGERDVYIPLRREVPVVQKETVVDETVHVGKDFEAQQTNINTRLREEQLKMDVREGIGSPGGVSTGSGSSQSGGNQAQPQSVPERVDQK